MIKKIIDINVNEQLRNKNTLPLFISGHTGIGKSSIVRQYARDNGFELVEFSAPTITIENMSGLPTSKNDIYLSIFSENNETEYTTWSFPEIIYMANIRTKNDKKVILFIDDFHMVNKFMQGYFFKLLLEKGIGSSRLSDNVVIIGAMNNSQEAGFNGINSAIRNRIGIFNYELDKDKFIKEIAINFNHIVYSFLKSNSEYIIEDEVTTIEGYATPRAWEAISNEMNAVGNVKDVKLLSEIVKKYVSKQLYHKMEEHIRHFASIDFEEILRTKKANLDTSNVLDSVSKAFIVNFIQTEEDGLNLLDILKSNYENEPFVTFIVSNAIDKIKNGIINSGLNIVSDVLVGNEFDSNKYDSEYEKKYNTLMNNKNIKSIIDTASKML